MHSLLIQEKVHSNGITPAHHYRAVARWWIAQLEPFTELGLRTERRFGASAGDCFGAHVYGAYPRRDLARNAHFTLVDTHFCG